MSVNFDDRGASLSLDSSSVPKLVFQGIPMEDIPSISVGQGKLPTDSSFEDSNSVQDQLQQERLSNSNNRPPEHDRMKGKRQTNVRNYELYKGKLLFFCEGRFLTGRSFWAFCVSLILLIGPSVLFFTFT
jgi:hypothetical protein